MMLSHLQIRNPKDDETGCEASVQIFSALLSHHVGNFRRLFVNVDSYAFEIFLTGRSVYYYVTAPKPREHLIHSLIQASYPHSALQNTTDPMTLVLSQKHYALGQIKMNHTYHLPIKTYVDFQEVDPLTSLIGLLSRQPSTLRAAIQILVSPATFAWHGKTQEKKSPTTSTTSDTEQKNTTPSISVPLMSKKILFQGGRTAIRVLVSSSTSPHDALGLLQNIGGTFGTFAQGEGNSLSLGRVRLRQQSFLTHIQSRTFGYFEHRSQIMNAQELATIWHPSGSLLKGIKNIAWGKTLSGEPPENLPTIDHIDDDEKKDVNFFANAEYKNTDAVFGIKTKDRRKHMYIIGKTGAGKSTLIANMAIDDIRRDRGVGIIDPHGDLCETILNYIPRRRMKDVVYLEPFDPERPFSLNVLEVKSHQHKDLIASGIVSIFYKIYGESWGPRLEYILRNTILTLLEIPDATLAEALPLLSDPIFRKKNLVHVKDPVLHAFWTNEYDKMTDKLRVEAISPIQNKVGQFVSSRTIRNIIGHPTSSINLEEIMNSGKILLLNLSQGKLGEDNAALLGAMIITQIQLAAMNRSFQKEDERKDFFMYVDEFQNFATKSFVKILSEARKYRLALTLANQYIEQLDEDVMTAIFGNVGSLISFVIGARDAAFLSKEFSELYSQNDLVTLGKYQVVMKMSIDEMTSLPFPARTLPLPSVKNEHADTIVRMSKERYGRSTK